MKTLFIGDLHGNIDTLLKAVAKTQVDRFVFMGDYLDSYDRSCEDQIAVLTTVLSLCQANPDRFIGLIGNHELSYINPKMQCSGYNYKTQGYVNHLKDLISNVLKPFFWVEEGVWLATHAGVSNELLAAMGVNIQEYLNRGPCLQIGKIRGGTDPIGGMYWCHWDSEFEAVPGVNQIAGHTHYRHTGALKTVQGVNSVNYCVDTLPQLLGDQAEPIFLLLDKGMPKTVTLDDL